MKPVIGITLSLDAERQLHATANFSRLIEAAGGTAVLLPYEFGEIGLLDAVIFSGGGDLDPVYAEYDRAEIVTNILRERDDAEARLFFAAREKGLPMLGICRGCQLMAALSGGSLIADIAAAGVMEEHSLPKEERHTIHAEAGSLAERLLPREVWSSHHQAVDRPGNGFRVTARSPMGVVEAIEAENGRMLGIQSHPEYMGLVEPFLWLVHQAG